MQFRYAHARSFEDYASGHVLVSAPGRPAFPVRLASELFSRALAHLDGDGPVTLWDPCCGSGYLLTTLALLHPDRIDAVVATDADADAVEIARRNLALLTKAGMSARRGHLVQLAAVFGKDSHRRAAEAAARIAPARDVPTTAAVADVLDPGRLRAVLAGRRPDVVLADVPYGDQTSWHTRDGDTAAMVGNLGAVLPEWAVVVVVDRARHVAVPGVRPLEAVRHGHRAAAFFRAADVAQAPVSDAAAD